MIATSTTATSDFRSLMPSTPPFVGKGASLNPHRRPEQVAKEDLNTLVGRDRARQELRPRRRGVRAYAARLPVGRPRTAAGGRRRHGARPGRRNRQADPGSRAPVRARDRGRAARRDARDPRACRAGRGGATGQRGANPARRRVRRRGVRSAGVSLVRPRSCDPGDRTRVAARWGPRARVERAGREPAEPLAHRLSRVPAGTAARAFEDRRHAAVARAHRARPVRRTGGGVGAARARPRSGRATRQRALGELDRKPRPRRSRACARTARGTAAGERVRSPEPRKRVVGRPVVSWDETRVRGAIASVVGDAQAALDGGEWPVHPLDDDVSPAERTTLYLGAAGMIWALRRLGSALDLDTLATVALERYRGRANPAEEASLFAGEPALLLLTRSDDERLRALIAANEHNPIWELLYGSAGSIVAARAVGFDAEAERLAHTLFEERDADGLWTQQFIQHGHEARYLGPAHGFAGNVHVLRGFVPDDVLRPWIESVLRAHAVWDGETVNWPPIVGADTDRIQWCHGAPGIVATLGDLMPEDLLLGG